MTKTKYVCITTNHSSYGFPVPENFHGQSSRMHRENGQNLTGRYFFSRKLEISYRVKDEIEKKFLLVFKKSFLKVEDQEGREQELPYSMHRDDTEIASFL